jgi:hypothetical protein
MFRLLGAAPDPFMWTDQRGRWHVINHEFNTGQTDQCGTSTLSAHFFSEDGQQWHGTDGVQPYGHTVQYDDGTNHTYCTLERPNIVIDPKGQITHLTLAADLITGDEGCAARGRGCCDCKYDDHAGTIVVSLDV